MKDTIVKQGNQIVGHAQLKDTASISGAAKTIRQINASHYNKTKILATKETGYENQRKNEPAGLLQPYFI